jgi:hypothetical protein
VVLFPTFTSKEIAVHKKLLFWVAVFAVAIQFIRPDFHNPKINDAVALHPSKPVAMIMDQACNDCHSDKTKYPWYSNVAPVSWFMANHIDDGRKAINFSNWKNIDTDTRIARLERATHLLKIGLMPLSSYQLMHKGAKLTAQQRDTLISYFDKELKLLKASEPQRVARNGTIPVTAS